MQQSHNVDIKDENDLKKLLELILRNRRLFILCAVVAIGLAFCINLFTVPIYRVSSSILIRENKTQQNSSGVNDFLNSSLFGKNQNFQNELWVLKSSTVIEQVVRDLGLEVTYYRKERLQYRDAYQNVPFQVFFLSDHSQPVGVIFKITFLADGSFQLKAESKKATFYNFKTEEITHQKSRWNFFIKGKFGELIETADLAFIIKPDSTVSFSDSGKKGFGFDFKTVSSMSNRIKKDAEFNVVDKMATVIQIRLKTESLRKGIDMVNGLMSVYSDKNLQQKNHIASITIDYIEKQLNEITDSLDRTEDNLQKFRSSNQLLNITEQATGISAQYMNLQNQLAELVTKKRYYDYVTEYLSSNDNFSEMIVPSSFGIQDPLLNSLMSELITAQAQRSNLIENNQEKNPLVQKLGIQIENVKQTISQNIISAGKTTSISIDEMNKRIKKTSADISRLPQTQRQLGSIERKYRLNDAIYNYLLEKRAEANITRASNLPDDLIIENAKMVGLRPISPNKPKNYIISLILGLALPFGFVLFKSALNNKVEVLEDIERLTNLPVLGKILHNNYKSSNVMLERPESNIAESFRVLRTNLDFYVRGGQKKVIMVTSCQEHEGKSFIAKNLAISYAQLGRKTILVNFDLRKPNGYFKDNEGSSEGLSSYLIDKKRLEDIILQSPHDKLEYILSGILPPNPVELLALDKTEKLISSLKEIYDIVVLDTTPLAQVTDAYLLVDHSELKIMIVRQGLTLKNVFSLIMKDLQQKKVNNVCVVLNDNRFFREQYGYGYGYGNIDKDNTRKERKMKMMISDFWKAVVKRTGKS